MTDYYQDRIDELAATRAQAEATIQQIDATPAGGTLAAVLAKALAEANRVREAALAEAFFEAAQLM